MKDVYTQILAISTIAAIVTAAVALLILIALILVLVLAWNYLKLVPDVRGTGISASDERMVSAAVHQHGGDIHCQPTVILGGFMSRFKRIINLPCSKSPKIVYLSREKRRHRNTGIRTGISRNLYGYLW